MSAKQWHRKRKWERIERDAVQLLTYMDADYVPVGDTVTYSDDEALGTPVKITLRERLYLRWWKAKSRIRDFFRGG